MNAMNPIEKGLQGFKRSELDADPKRVFESDDFKAEELPEGVRLFLREKRIDLPGKKVLVNVYRIIDDGGLKERRLFVGKMEARKPEDHEIAERFGKGSFVWMMKWIGGDGQERGLLSERIEIGEEGEDLHREWLQRQKGDAGISPNSGALGSPPVALAPAAATSAFGPAEFLAMMEKAEDKAMARIERIMAMVQGRQSESAGEVLKEAYKGANEMMAKAVQTNLDMVRVTGKHAQEQMRAMALPAPEPEEVLPPEEEAAAMPLPAWLKPFMPLVEKGIEKLFAGGPLGSAVKTLILSSEEWQEIFNDPEKWGQAVSAMERQYGSEKTRKALDILLNRRAEGDKAKTKGRK